MKIAVIGSRNFNDYDYLKDKLLIIINDLENCTIISGGARGADSLGERFAKEFKIDTLILKPDWEKFGKSAGFLRNKDIIENSDIVCAFWDSKSAGTKHSINLAKKTKKDTFIFYV